MSDPELLLFLDGEVDRTDEARIQQHLTACWSCRARRDELQSTITTVVRAMDEVVLPQIPPPPAPWDGLLPHLVRLDREFNNNPQPTWWSRGLLGVLVAPRVRWATAALLVVAASVVLLYQPRATAAELLSRAHSVERLDAHRRLVLEERNTSTGRLIALRRIDVWQNATRGEKARRLYDESDRLLAGEWTHSDGSRMVYRRGESPRREAADVHVSATRDNVWRLELAASTFAAVTEAASSARVDEKADAYVLSSTLASGRDAAALERDTGPLVMELTLSKRNLHPIEQSITFGTGADAQTFRLIENGFEFVTSADFPQAAFVPEPELTAELAAAPVVPPIEPVLGVSRLSPEELRDLEVRALARLNSVGALMGEQVSVSPTSDGLVLVQALVNTAARKNEISRALESLTPLWAVRTEIQTFDDAQRRAPPQQPTAPVVVRSVEIAGAQAPVYDDLRRHFAGRISRGRTANADSGDVGTADTGSDIDREIQRLTGRVLERSLQARLHARALTQIVSRVSPADLRRLSSVGLQEWQMLVREHAGAFRRETEALREDLQPIFFPVPPPVPTPERIERRDLDLWQAASRLFELASAHDVTVGQAFAISVVDPSLIRLKSDEFWQSLMAAEALALDLQDALVPAVRVQ